MGFSYFSSVGRLMYVYIVPLVVTRCATQCPSMSLDIKVIPSLCTQVLDRDEKWVYVVEYARPKMSIRLERIFKSLLCNQF